MDDDLDAFFDDVENAEKEAQETTAADNDDDQNNGNGTTESASATDPEEGRPAKRAKAASAAASSVASLVPVKKAIVASSVPVISIVPPLPAGPPPTLAASAVVTVAAAIIPPPPPPNSNYHSTANTNTNNNNGNGNGYQTNTPAAAANNPPLPPNPNDNDGKVHVRSAAGTTWSDATLAQWPANDFRLFVGNLAKDLKQHHLEQHFGIYPSFAMARLMYNKADGKSRGYGFVSLLDPKDCAKAIREKDQSWLGSRPIKVKLSEWKDREWKEVKKRGKVAKRKKKHFGL